MNTPEVVNRRASWAGLAAIVGGVMAIVLTPPFAIAYFVAYPGSDAVPPWVIANLIALTPLIAFDTPVAVYNLYGRIYDVVYALFLPSAFALHALHRHGQARLEKWGFFVLVAGLLACFVGVAGDYWADGAGFFLEFCGLLILAAGATLYGVALLRSKALPGWYAWPLVACGPGMFVSFALVGHVPSGPTLPFATCWFLAGCALLLGKRARLAG
jgi:hypothetical protein